MSERKVIRAANTLDQQINAVVSALEIGEQFVDPELVDAAASVISRSQARRSLSADHTVIGLFGATGSGKSTLFNQLVGSEVAQTGVIRPTTTETVAAVWVKEGSGQLLDWLEVEHRHYPELEVQHGGLSRLLKADQGLILLDLPDMDSTSTTHHEISRRLTSQVDFMVWILDPQKYADASIHHGYLSGMSNHHEHLLILLNQVDRIPEAEHRAVRDSLESILFSEGMASAQLQLVSANTGMGIEKVERTLAKVTANKALKTRRLKVDVDEVIRGLESELAVIKVSGPSKSAQADLDDTISRVHGVELIADAVESSYRLRASKSTGWPLTSWLVRLKNDPLKRMNLGRDHENSSLSITSRPALSKAESASIDLALSRYAAVATEDLPTRWQESVGELTENLQEPLGTQIDEAIAATDLGVNQKSWWWPLTKAAQWISLVVALAGACWLAGIGVAGYLQFQLPAVPRVEGIALPTLLLITGMLLGIVIGLLGSFLNRMVAKMKRRRAQKNLERSVSQVTRHLVFDPVAEQLERYNSYAALISGAAKKAE